MPQLRSGKVVTAREVKSADRMVASPSCLGAEVGCEPGKELVVRQRPPLAPKRKPGQPLPCCMQPAVSSSDSGEQFAPLVPMQKEQGESSQRLPGKKNKGVRCRRAARSKKGVTLPVSDTAVCEDWQAATTAAAVCLEEAVRTGTGQGQQPFSSGTTLQNKSSTGIEMKEHSSEGLSLSAFQESSGSSAKKGRDSFMEVKVQIPFSEEEVEDTERHGVSCLPEPEVLHPSTHSTEMESTGSLTILKMQIPDLEKNLGAQESLCEPKPQEEVDMPERSDGYTLIEARKPGTQEKRKRCLNKKGRTSLKPKLQGPREGGRSALVELHIPYPESKKGALSLRKKDRNMLVSEQLQGVSGQALPTSRGKMHKRCMQEEQQSSDPQKGADGLGESGKHLHPIVEAQVQNLGSQGKGLVWQ